MRITVLAVALAVSGHIGWLWPIAIGIITAVSYVIGWED